MTQIQIMELLYPVLRLAGMRKRRAYLASSDAAMWIHSKLWCVRDPATWWSYRRRLSLLRRGRWEIRA